MLVKFKNDSPEFEEKVEKLKEILSVGAASKVAEHCVNNYQDLDVRYQKAMLEIDILNDKLRVIKNAVYQQEQADLVINQALRGIDA